MIVPENRALLPKAYDVINTRNRATPVLISDPYSTLSELQGIS
jgi:hypothetical protein